MEENDLLSKISRKINILIALMIEDRDTRQMTKDKVKYLKQFGINSQEIAEIIGTTKNTVDVISSKLKHES